VVRRLPRPFLLPVAAAILAAVTAGPVAARVTLPSPGDRSVHDLAGVITPDDARAMERLHRELFTRTGVALVVITVPRLDGEPIEDFALRVGEEWGLGRKGQDRGIVVALAVEERRIHVATGYGVEGYLPDGRVGAILDRYVLPRLRHDDFSGALRQASAALAQASAREFGATLDGEAPTPAAGEENGPLSWGAALFLLLALLLVGGRFLLFMLAREARWRHSARRPRGGFFGGGFGGGTGFGGFGGGGFGGGGFGGGFGGFGGGGFGGGGAGRGF
jgi:uncharacterized protein